jgi:hypothetical protein
MAKKSIRQKKNALSPRNKTHIKHVEKPGYDKYVAHALERMGDCASKNIIINELMQMGCKKSDADALLSTMSNLYLTHDEESMKELFGQLRLANSKMLQQINIELNKNSKDPTWHALKIKVLENMRRLLPKETTVTVKGEDDINKIFFDVHNLNDEEND